MQDPHRASTRVPALSTLLCLGLSLSLGCGEPAEREGAHGQGFDRASMGFGGPSSGKTGAIAVEPVSWLVSFNRLHTAAALEMSLNKKPGQFSTVDLDRDGTPDTVAVRQLKHDDGPAFELRAQPRAGEAKVVATLLFDHEWNFIGSYDGAMPGATPVTAPSPGPAIATAPSSSPSVASSTAAVASTKDHSKGLAMQPIGWLVKFNKLHTASSLESAINRTPGEFSKVDTDGDGHPDFIAVGEKRHETGRAFELRARPSGTTGEGVVVATLVFDSDWAMTGWYNGVAP